MPLILGPGHDLGHFQSWGTWEGFLLQSHQLSLEHTLKSWGRTAFYYCLLCHSQGEALRWDRRL